MPVCVIEHLPFVRGISPSWWYVISGPDHWPYSERIPETNTTVLSRGWKVKSNYYVDTLLNRKINRLLLGGIISMRRNRAQRHGTRSGRAVGNEIRGLARGAYEGAIGKVRDAQNGLRLWRLGAEGDSRAKGQARARLGGSDTKCGRR